MIITFDLQNLNASSGDMFIVDNCKDLRVTRLDFKRYNKACDDLEKLQKAIDNAGKRGAREAILFYKDTVFLTSIRNNTIITAVNSKEKEENIFTNIDSAVVVGE